MQIYQDLAQIPAPFEKAYITIGNFDGVHLGHQILFSEVVNRLTGIRGQASPLPSSRIPLKIVRPEKGIKLISTYEQKLELIELANIDILIVLPFSRNLPPLRPRPSSIDCFPAPASPSWWWVTIMPSARAGKGISLF